MNLIARVHIEKRKLEGYIAGNCIHLDGYIGIIMTTICLIFTVPGLLMGAEQTLLPILTITKQDLYYFVHVADEEFHSDYVICLVRFIINFLWILR